MVHFKIRRLGELGSAPQNGIYREPDFRYLLENERKRSDRSGHLCRVLLVYITDARGSILQMEPEVATMVVGVMIRNLRKTDYIGWYSEGRVVGGVLTSLGRESLGNGCARVRSNVADILKAELGQTKSLLLQIRLYPQEEVREVEFI